MSADLALSREKIDAEWQRALAAGRTGLKQADWREGFLNQVAVAWVLVAMDDISTRPMVGTTPVPVITPSQWMPLPTTWLHTHLDTGVAS